MEEKDSSDFFGSQNRLVVELQPSDFNPHSTWKLNNHKCSIVLFYAPWCPHCQSLKGVWEELGELAAYYTVAAFNCEKYKRHLSNIKEDQPGLIGGYPTIVIYQNGHPIEVFKDEKRTVANLEKACRRACKLG